MLAYANDRGRTYEPLAVFLRGWSKSSVDARDPGDRAKPIAESARCRAASEADPALATKTGAALFHSYQCSQRHSRLTRRQRSIVTRP